METDKEDNVSVVSKDESYISLSSSEQQNHLLYQRLTAPTTEVPNLTALSKGKQNDLLHQRDPLRVYEVASETVAVAPSSPTAAQSAVVPTTATAVDNTPDIEGPSGQQNYLLEQSDYVVPLDRQDSLPTASGDCASIACPTTPVRSVTKRLLQTPSPTSKRLREDDNLKSASRKYYK